MRALDLHPGHARERLVRGEVARHVDPVRLHEPTVAHKVLGAARAAEHHPQGPHLVRVREATPRATEPTRARLVHVEHVLRQRQEGATVQGHILVVDARLQSARGQGRQRVVAHPQAVLVQERLVAQAVRSAVPEVDAHGHAHGAPDRRALHAARDDKVAPEELLPEEEGQAQHLVQLLARSPEDARVEHVATGRPWRQGAEDLLKEFVREDQDRSAPSLLSGAFLGWPCPRDGDHWFPRGGRSSSPPLSETNSLCLDSCNHTSLNSNFRTRQFDIFFKTQRFKNVPGRRVQKVEPGVLHLMYYT